MKLKTILTLSILLLLMVACKDKPKENPLLGKMHGVRYSSGTWPMSIDRITSKHAFRWSTNSGSGIKYAPLKLPTYKPQLLPIIKPDSVYYYFEVDIALTNGCTSSARASKTWYKYPGDESINYNAIKSALDNWVYPEKIKSFEITKLRLCTKSEFDKVGNGEFKCPDTLNWIYLGKLNFNTDSL